MKEDNINVLKTACVYTGTVLGAGFASGRELLNFFVSYGSLGFLGLIVSGALFAVIGCTVLKIVYENNITGYSQFSKYLLGNTLGKGMEMIVLLFLLVLFATMVAAGGEMADSVFGADGIKGEVIIGALCFAVFLFDLDGLVEINVVLCPVLVLGGIFVGLYIFLYSPAEVFSYVNAVETSVVHNFAVSAVIYVSYNIITAVSVLVSLNKLITSRKTAVRAGMTGGICMCVLGICMALPVFAEYGNISMEEMPMLKLVMNYNIIKYIYIVILLAAVFTTAAANGFAVIEWLEKRTSVKKIYIKLIVAVWGILAAQIGFSNFVGGIYPLFGYIGLVEMAVILKKAFTCK